MTFALIGTGWAEPGTTEVGSCRSVPTGETVSAITAVPEPTAGPPLECWIDALGERAAPSPGGGLLGQPGEAGSEVQEDGRDKRGKG
jgi:hypothetical protein